MQLRTAFPSKALYLSGWAGVNDSRVSFITQPNWLVKETASKHSWGMLLVNSSALSDDSTGGNFPFSPSLLVVGNWHQEFRHQIRELRKSADQTQLVYFTLSALFSPSNDHVSFHSRSFPTCEITGSFTSRSWEALTQIFGHPTRQMLLPRSSERPSCMSLVYISQKPSKRIWHQKNLISLFPAKILASLAI